MNLGKVGFVFTGGGFTGAYSVGFVKALAAKGIKPSYVQAISVGSLTAAKLMETDWDIGALERIWVRAQEMGQKAVFNWKDFLPSSPKDLFAWEGFLPKKMAGVSIFSNQKIFDNLVKDLNFQAIADSPIEFQVVVVRKGAEVEQMVFSNHDEAVRRNPLLIRDAMMASIGLPGFLPPIMIDGQWYSDGTTLRNRDLVKSKCDTIFIFLNCLYNRLPNVSLERLRWFEHFLLELQSINNLLTTEKISRLIERGYQLVENNPSGVFKDVKPFAKMRKRINKLIGGLAEAAKGEDVNSIGDAFAVPRVVVMTPSNMISSLYTLGFKQADPQNSYPGDIVAAIEHCAAQTDEFWAKLGV